MASAPHVLLIDAAPKLCERLRDTLESRGFTSDSFPLDQDNVPTWAPTDLAVLVLDPLAADNLAPRTLPILETLVEKEVPTLVWGLSPQAGRPASALLECVAADESLEEVAARLTTMGRYAPLVGRMQDELGKLQRLGTQLNRYFAEIDQELRLAGRLQRDFLPSKLPQVPPLTFATFYRPASWVSGDMYDVFRIDESHVGLFMTDAMGHGIAAGLLTMFLRQALVSKRVTGRKYQIVSPAEAIENLNTCLVRQQLPNCQFVTAAYAIIDVDKLELRSARGGHPHPILIKPDGHITELPAPGGLLGIADLPSDFGENRTRLEPGDKVLLYTDGIQDAIIDPALTGNGEPVFTDRFREWAQLDVHALTAAVGNYLDNLEGSLHQGDDVTVLAVEVST